MRGLKAGVTTYTRPDDSGRVISARLLNRAHGEVRLTALAVWRGFTGV